MKPLTTSRTASPALLPPSLSFQLLTAPSRSAQVLGTPSYCHHLWPALSTLRLCLWHCQNDLLCFAFLCFCLVSSFFKICLKYLLLCQQDTTKYLKLCAEDTNSVLSPPRNSLGRVRNLRLAQLGCSGSGSLMRLAGAAVPSERWTRAGGSTSKLTDMALGRSLQFLASWTFSGGRS